MRYLVLMATIALVLLTSAAALAQSSDLDLATSFPASWTESDQLHESSWRTYSRVRAIGEDFENPWRNESCWQYSNDVRPVSLEPTKNDSKRPPMIPFSLPGQGGTAARSVTYSFPNRHERFHRYILNIFGPFAIAEVAVSAGAGVWENRPTEWGRTWRGYGKQFASAFGANLVDETVSYTLSEALREDSAFYKSNRTTTKERAFDAIIQSVTSRTRDGKRVFSVPQIAGDFAGGFVVLAWQPQRYTYRDGLRYSGTSLLFDMAGNLLKEFVFH